MQILNGGKELGSLSSGGQIDIIRMKVAFKGREILIIQHEMWRWLWH